MVVNHNIPSLLALSNVDKTDSAMSTSLERLSSGKRINKAADDAAGLAISEKMNAQIKGLAMAKRNAMDGISLVQTAEGGMAQISDILQRIRELAVQSANGTYSPSDRSNSQAEASQLLSEINEIAGNTKFNGLSLLDGTYKTSGVTFQIGVNSGDTMSALIPSLKTTDLSVGVVGNSTVTNLSLVDLQNEPQESLKALDRAIEEVTTKRANLGAYQNRLTHTISNLTTISENLISAESRIVDTDMAQEMSEFSKCQVLMQSGVAMLAQANQKTQSILKLLQ